MADAITPPAHIPFGIPYKTDVSIHNSKIVLDAVKRLYPEWAPQCEPYVNVLTMRAWNQRGFRVKKGEHAIRVGTLIPVQKKDAKTGEKVEAGTRPGRAFVFALPQVEKIEDPSTESPRRLPIEEIGGIPHYRDDRLQEYREVENPLARISFEEMAQGSIFGT